MTMALHLRLGPPLPLWISIPRRPRHISRTRARTAAFGQFGRAPFCSYSAASRWSRWVFGRLGRLGRLNPSV